VGGLNPPPSPTLSAVPEFGIVNCKEVFCTEVTLITFWLLHVLVQTKGKVYVSSHLSIRPALICGFCSAKRPQQLFLLPAPPLNGLLGRSRGTSSIEFVLVSVEMYRASYMPLSRTQHNCPGQVLLSMWFCNYHVYNLKYATHPHFRQASLLARVNHSYTSPYSLTRPSKLSMTEKSRYCYCVYDLFHSQTCSFHHTCRLI